MSGLLRRLTRRRPATADENRSPATASSEPVAAPAETPAEPGGQPPVPEEQPTVVLPATAEQPAQPVQPLPAWTVAADQPTAYAAQPAPARDLPAGVDPADLAAAPAASSRRGKLRRRLRYLRHVRELLLRDLGGFTYEIHRTAGGTAQDPQRRLAAAKTKRISALDAEVLALESRLGEPHETLLREPGIGGTCPECGELHASDAHFCSRCGTGLDEKARAQRAAEQPLTGSQPVVEPQPASVLWAGGPRPVPEPAPADEEKAEPPSEVTSQWLATDQPTTFSRASQSAKPAAEPSPTTTETPAAEADPKTAETPAAEADPKTTETPAAEADPTTAETPAAEADPKTAETPAAEADPKTAAEPSATTAVEPDEAAPPAPATAAAQAKPKRAAKPRKPAKRTSATPRAVTPKPEAPRTERDEAQSPAPQTDGPKRNDPPSANGRRDEDVPPPLSSGDPLTTPREQRP
jgi:hypothetical protein